jgi:xanthine dehydrogenase YagR molybdenum-binding subunit
MSDEKKPAFGPEQEAASKAAAAARTVPLVGRPLVRRDGRAKVTGAARYSAEIPVSGIAYGVLVTSAVARGRIESIDSSEAEREPGVLAVITPANALRLPGGGAPADGGDRVVQPLQDDRILFSNQPVALAVADTFERAVHAALLVRVRAAQEKWTVRMEDELHNAFAFEPTTAAGKRPADRHKGDVPAALLQAEVKHEATYETPPETHNPMEPHATTAVWSGPDKLTVYDSTQGIFGVQKKLAKAFGIAPGNVRVLTRFVGGGFGCKGSAWSHVLIAALAAKQLGRPVKVVLSRQQMFGPVGGRPRTKQTLALGATRDGALRAMRHVSVSTTSRFDEFLEPCANVTQHAYASPNIQTSLRLVRLDIGTPTYMRAPGESSGGFALETAMDELAVKLGLDPLELRLRNYAVRDPLEDKPFSSKSLRACYAEGARRFGWEQRRKEPRAVVRDGMLVGLGMATASYPANLGAAQALARVLPDGSAVVQSGAVDIGTGTYTVMAQLAAEALGLPPERVQFELGDTDLPEAPRSGGSQTAASVGSAVLLACAGLRDKLKALAVSDPRSPLHGAGASEVRLEEGRLTAPGGRSEAVAELVQRAGAPVEQRAATMPDEERKKYALHAFGAQFAEVLVDPDLGMVRVARLVGVFAAGRILNARLARSQLMGGMVWGMGMALHEHSVYDDRLGRIMTRDLADYHVPAHADVPSVEPYLIAEDDARVAPSGVKGLGEIGICGAAAAIGNAVYNATGRRIRTLPITADKLM